MKRYLFIVILFFVCNVQGQITISNNSNQPVLSINSKTLGLILPRSNGANVKEDGLLFFNSNPNNPDKSDGLKYVTSNPENNGYNDSVFTDAVTPNFFQNDIEFKSKDTIQYFVLKNVNHFSDFNLNTKHYIDDLPNENPQGHRPWTVSITFKPLENETINPLWFFGSKTSTKGIMLYLDQDQLKFRYGFENNEFFAENCENNPAANNAHSINFESTKSFKPNNWYTITVQFKPEYIEENDIKRDVLPIKNNQFLIFENTQNDLNTIEGNWSEFDYGEAENCAYNLEGNFYLGYGRETSNSYFKGNIRSLHYSSETINQETLNTYAIDGVKWWFSHKDQEGFNPDNHEFWLMGNGDKDTNIKIFNATNSKSIKFLKKIINPLF